MKKKYFFLTAFSLIFGLANAQENITEDDVISDFENLSLEPDSYWNGSDLSGSFTSGGAVFPNAYNPDFMSWSQWAYSNMADDSTAGFMNQYSAITAAGYDPPASGGSNYAVGYAINDFVSLEVTPVPLRIADSMPLIVKGFYVTNSTYAALSMKFGDDYSKKFGGETGDDPDYFKLMVWGLLGGAETDTIEFFLADYRFANNAEDYILEEWEWVDTESIGKVDSLMLSLESTDVGDWGMNTPGYFCIDNLAIAPEDAGLFEPLSEAVSMQVYPNPATKLVNVHFDGTQYAEVSIYDLSGMLIYSNAYFRTGGRIDLGSIPAGCYILKVQDGRSVGTEKLILR